MVRSNKSLWLCAGMISVLSMYGCDENDDSNNGSGTCDVATFQQSCTGNIQLSCGADGKIAATPCANGCNGNACATQTPTPTQCDPATYQQTCTGNIQLSCGADGQISATPCANGCSGNTCAAAPIPVPECDPANYQQTCTQNTLISCSADGKITTTSCANGCEGNTCAGTNPPVPECDPATYAQTCSGNMQISCSADGKLVSTPCDNGCEGNACASAPAPATPCDPAAFQNTCANNTMSMCVSGKVMTIPCNFGCKADGTACAASAAPAQECTPGSAPVCASNVLKTCGADGKYTTTTCDKGCNAAGNACESGSTPAGDIIPACTAGAGTEKAGTTSGKYTFTGCACDNTYKKSCGRVNGKEVAFTCYNNNEEYLECDACTIDGSGKYQCGGGSGGGGSTGAGLNTTKGEVNVVDAKYANLNIKENDTGKASIEKFGDSQNIDASDPTITKCAPLTISDTSNTCAKTGSSTSKYVIQGDILTKDGVFEGGSVVVEGNKITYVGCTPDTANATVITCPNAVVSAGFINAHDHIGYANGAPDSWGAERFDHRHDWRKAKNGHTNHNGPSTKNNEVGELRQLMGGTTSIFGSGSNAGLARNIDKKGEVSGASGYPTYDTFPLSDSGGAMYDNGCSKFKLSGKYNSNFYYGPHIGEGINDAALNEFKCLANKSTGLIDMFTSKLAVIHGVSATPEVIKYMGEQKSKLIWSPRTNVSLYGDTARVTVYDNYGVTIALGSDWIYSGSANMLREFECVDFLNSYYYNHHFSDYDIWMMATYNGAVAFGYEKFLGNLAPGLLADLAVFKKDPSKNKTLHRAVINAENKDVTFVMIDGKAFMGDANIMSTGENVDVCGSSKKIDTKITGTSMSYSDIKKYAAYDIFFCGKPSKEPTCVPMRTRPTDTTSQGTTLYDGEYTDALDRDGDGIPDSIDNCPDVFNPVRPEDKNASNKLGQGDFDGDGFGDVCDKAPLDKNVH